MTFFKSRFVLCRTSHEANLDVRFKFGESGTNLGINRVLGNEILITILDSNTS